MASISYANVDESRSFLIAFSLFCLAACPEGARDSLHEHKVVGQVKTEGVGECTTNKNGAMFVFSQYPLENIPNWASRIFIFLVGPTPNLILHNETHRCEEIFRNLFRTSQKSIQNSYLLFQSQRNALPTGGFEIGEALTKNKVKGAPICILPDSQTVDWARVHAELAQARAIALKAGAHSQSNAMAPNGSP